MSIGGDEGPRVGGVRAYVYAGSPEGVYWFSFDMPNSSDEEQYFYGKGDTEDSPIELQPSPALSINFEDVDYSASFIGMGSKLYALGGIERPPNIFLRHVHCFDTAANNNLLGWHRLPDDMILPRSCAQVVGVDGKLFVMGGVSGPRSLLNYYNDPENSEQISHLEANWAEFYDPAQTTGWKPVLVREFIDDDDKGKSSRYKPDECRPILPFLGYGVGDDPAFIRNFHFRIGKLGDDKIVIFCWKSYLIYDVRTKTLTKKTNVMGHEFLRRFPYVAQILPVLVGDSVFTFDVDSFCFGAFDYDGKVLGGLSRPFEASGAYIPGADCAYPMTFRTDAFPHDDSDKTGAKRHLHFIRAIFSEKYQRQTNLLQLITLKAVPDELESCLKSVYFTVPTKLCVVVAAIFLPSHPTQDNSYSRPARKPSVAELIAVFGGKK